MEKSSPPKEEPGEATPEKKEESPGEDFGPLDRSAWLDWFVGMLYAAFGMEDEDED